MKQSLVIAALIILMSCQKNQDSMLENAKIIERVSFKLNEGFSPDQGKKAMLLLNEFVAVQPGYVARSTSVDDSNLFLDIVYWETMQDAKAAAEKVMAEKSFAKVFDVINQESMDFGHFEIFNIQ